MRQSQREIVENSELEVVLAAGQVCHLAINCPGSAPYIAAMNYGYDFEISSGRLRLWLHSATSGYKLDLIRLDPRVGFQIESRLAVSTGTGVQACDWGMQFESLVGQGLIQIVEQREDRLFGLSRLMDHYGGAHLPMLEQALSRTTVLCLDVGSFTGKRSRGLWPQLA